MTACLEICKGFSRQEEEICWPEEKVTLWAAFMVPCLANSRHCSPSADILPIVKHGDGDIMLWGPIAGDIGGAGLVNEQEFVSFWMHLIA